MARGRKINGDLAETLKKMVSCRNLFVHEYQKIDFSVVANIIERGLDDLLKFTDRVMELH